MDSAGVFGTSNAHLANSMLEMPRTLPVSPPAQKHDVTSELLAQFKGLIAQGIVRPGMKLPPERELAGSFNVSRSSLRHALKVLDSMGVIRQRVGDGTYLTTSAASILSQPLEFPILLDGISLSDLMETRLMVEPELAARAAERATSEDLVSLRRSIAGMKGERDEEKLVDLDLAFHDGILRASGNVLCYRLFSLIHKAMAKSILLTSRLVDWDHTMGFHRPICEAIDRRNPGAARRAMTEHLLDARDLLGRAYGTRIQHMELGDSIRPVAKRPRRTRNR
jgi:GntR family transcriptional repressor for pyruvate dehydrogenase complex